jgi:PBSX family phage portal protein
MGKKKRIPINVDSAIVNLKTHVIGKSNAFDGISGSNLQELDDEMSGGFDIAGGIEPTLDPLFLTRLISLSNSLRQNIDAMVTNVNGFGYSFVPAINLDSDDIEDTIKVAMTIERENEAEDECVDGEEISVVEPTDAEIKERLDLLKFQMRRQLAKVKAFFENCNLKVSFQRLNKRLLIDRYTTGNHYFEIRRDKLGVPRRLEHAPSWSIRAMPLERIPVEISRQVKITDITFENQTEIEFFRKYVQIYEGNTVYFKEFGDPRTMSSVTGKFYKDEKELEREENNNPPATEMIPFKVDTSESDIYGLPQWIGNLLSVIGSREMEEVNLLFWQHKSIPPMVVMVSGGALKKGARQRLERVIEEQIKGGGENFHKILILEAESTKKMTGGLPSQNTVKIEIQPLIANIWKDQLWGEYDKQNNLKVGRSFRLPPLLRGETEDYNYATSAVAKQFAEEQVFEPERQEIDFDINRTIVSDLGVYLWKFKLNGPKIRVPDRIVDFIEKLTKNVLTIEESRKWLSETFDMDLSKIDAEWAKMPSDLILAGMNPSQEGAFSEDSEEDNKEDSEEETEEEAKKTTKIKLSNKKMNELFSFD